MNFLFFVLKVVQVAVRAALQSSGQNCAGAERFYVHKDIYPEFVVQIVKVIKSISVVSMQYSLILLFVLVTCFGGCLIWLLLLSLSFYHLIS